MQQELSIAQGRRAQQACISSLAEGSPGRRRRMIRLSVKKAPGIADIGYLDKRGILPI